MKDKEDKDFDLWLYIEQKEKEQIQKQKAAIKKVRNEDVTFYDMFYLDAKLK